MSSLELSCGLPPGPAFADLAVLAEELGYDRVWIFDSAPLWEDALVHLALAAERTSTIGLSTAVLIPSQRSEMAMASGLATLARLSGGRLRAAFGTGYTSRKALGQSPISLDRLVTYVEAVRGLLEGETVVLEGKPTRMLHEPAMAAPRPLKIPLWLSVMGPRGNERAPEVAEGTIGGPVHPSLPTATMVSGTVLDPGEDRGSSRVRQAIGPWRVMGWHTAYSVGGAEQVDAMEGGRQWRAALEALASDEERHLLTFESHVTSLTERDEQLLEHIDVTTMVGEPSEIREQLRAISDAGYAEVMYNASGPDVARELRAFAGARP